MKKIPSLKNSGFARSFFAVRGAARMLPSLLLSGDDPREVLRSLVGKSAEAFVDEVGELKGSLLKAAQILSLYGEYYLPEEVNAVLKKVQSQGHYLPWEKISREIPPEFFSRLEIEEIPIAAASIGQVHRARVKATGQEIVLKIQYPGVKRAIDLDMKLIRSFFSLARIIPKKMNMDPIYEEIRKVLEEEMDYELELRKHQEFAALLVGVPGASVPRAYPEFSTEKVIASEFIDGASLSELSSLGAKERNALGETLFRIFFHEVFRGGFIQTDAHPGNYIYRNGTVYLLDFGACLSYPPETLRKYRGLITELFHRRRENFFRILRDVSGTESASYPEELLWEYCLLAASPLWSEDFDWGTTKLPDELYPLAMRLVKEAQVETPPHEFIFLDRKILGLFGILRSLGARFNVRARSLEYLG